MSSYQVKIIKTRRFFRKLKRRSRRFLKRKVFNPSFYHTLYLKLLGLKVGEKSFIHPQCKIKKIHKVWIGPDCHLDHFVTLSPGKEGIHIGENTGINSGAQLVGSIVIKGYCMVGPNAAIVGGNHIFKRADLPMKKQGSNFKGIIIEKDVWLGANCCVLDGVRIGEGSIVGAGAVVTKDVAPGSIVGGVPAVLIRKRS